jgi:hypothetical protein
MKQKLKQGLKSLKEYSKREEKIGTTFIKIVLILLFVCFVLTIVHEVRK